MTTSPGSVMPLPPDPNVPPTTAPPTTIAPSPQQDIAIELGRGYYGPPLLGRADVTNRFNVFDNMGAQPRTRIFAGFQYVQAQNNAIFVTNENERLFSILGTEAGRRLFIGFTGFGSGLGTAGGGGDVVVDPVSASSAATLRDLYLAENTGRTLRFTQLPDTNLYRFGFEYALTPDFSVAVQAQYVIPLEDVEQPELFSNPLIQVKHVFYRGEETLFSGVVGVSPAIPKPDFAIAEDTTRINPGFLVFHQLNEKLFVQAGTGFSLPTVDNNIKTWDYALGTGYWLYQHESLKRGYKGPVSNKLLQGVIPQLEVLGKHVIGDSTVVGLFDLSTLSPRTAPGTLSPVDGSTNIYFPQDLPNQVNRVEQVGLIFEEPRHVVDMTMGLTFLLRDQLTLSTGLSVPLTGGQSRAVEFILSLNRGF